MSSSAVATDDAKIRRGIAALQRFSQRKRGGLPMRFNPFGLLTKKRVAIEELPASTFVGEESDATISTASSSSSSSSTTVLFDVVEYKHEPTGISLPALLERNEMAAATTTDLQSANRDAVDNTGSYHWAAEDVLAHLLLTNPRVALTRHQQQERNQEKENESAATDSLDSLSASASPLFDFSSTSPPSFLELGAGVGLAGFFLAVSGKAKRIIVTDGNRRVTQILAANAQRITYSMTIAAAHQNNNDEGGADDPSPSSQLAAMLLPWQHADSDGAIAALLSANSLLGDHAYLVGADCLFFESFHADLARIVLKFLFPRWSDEKEDERAEGRISLKRKVVFVAPERGGSMTRFLLVLKQQAQNHFSSLHVTVTEQYDAGIFATHKKLFAEAPENGYSPDRHYPILLCVERKN